MTAVRIWVRQIGTDEITGVPILEKYLKEEGSSPPFPDCWEAEQDAEVWWEEIQATGKGRQYLKKLAEIINDGRIPSWNVTPRQLRHALNQMNMRTQIEAFMATADQNIKDYWEYSLYIDRYHPLVSQIAQQLGLSEQQVDDLFLLAESL